MPLNTENIQIHTYQIPIPVKYRFILPGLLECFPFVLELSVVCLVVVQLFIDTRK